MSAGLLPTGPQPTPLNSRQLSDRRPSLPAPPGEHTALPAPLRSLADRLPPTLLGLLLAGQLVAPAGWAPVSWLPVTLGLLLGLPHGAVDHLVPAWVRARRTPLPATAALLVGYVATAAVMLVLLRRYPLPGLLVFLAASLLHFGTGEVQYDRLRTHPAPLRRRRPPTAGAPVRTAAAAALQVLGWGGISVLLPLACWPAQVRPVLEALAPGSGRLLLAPDVRHAAAAVVLAAAGLTVARALRQRRYRPAAELSLLVAVFLLVPPLFAFAGYFGAWHSTRHIVRLLAADPANTDDLAAGRLAPALRRFARAAAWPTAAALLALLALVAATHGAQAYLAADLTLLAALTAPHMLLVGWLDRQTARPTTPAGAAQRSGRLSSSWLGSVVLRTAVR